MKKLSVILIIAIVLVFSFFQNANAQTESKLKFEITTNLSYGLYFNELFAYTEFFFLGPTIDFTIYPIHFGNRADMFLGFGVFSGAMFSLTISGVAIPIYAVLSYDIVCPTGIMGITTSLKLGIMLLNNSAGTQVCFSGAFDIGLKWYITDNIGLRLYLEYGLFILPFANGFCGGLGLIIKF